MNSTEQEQSMSTAATTQLETLLNQYRQVIKSITPEQLARLRQHFI